LPALLAAAAGIVMWNVAPLPAALFIADS